MPARREIQKRRNASKKEEDQIDPNEKARTILLLRTKELIDPTVCINACEKKLANYPAIAAN
jgi:hypothetical protein